MYSKAVSPPFFFVTVVAGAAAAAAVLVAFVDAVVSGIRVCTLSKPCTSFIRIGRHIRRSGPSLSGNAGVCACLSARGPFRDVDAGVKPPLLKEIICSRRAFQSTGDIKQNYVYYSWRLLDQPILS